MDSPSSDPLVVQLSTSGSSFPSNTEKIVDNIPRPRGGNKRKESPVWQWVYKIGFINDRGEKDAYAKCKKCELVMPSSTKRNGTTGIRNHLMKCEGNDLYVPPSSSQTTLSQKDFGGELVAHHFNQKRSDVKILEWIIRAEQPFRVVEHPAFKAFIQELQPKFKVPNRKKVASGIWDMFMSEKTKILENIGDLRISVTTDTWTSIQNINYMVVTTHFLDSDWKLHKRIVNFTKITSHKGEDIARVLDVCLSDWGIKKFFSVTVDNATANDKAIEYMKKRLKSRGTLLLNGIHLHMRCACHIINLIVKDGLKELGSSIEGIRNCVKFIHSSPARLDMFRNVAVLENMDKMANVPMDVVTRWNATYGMLTSAYKYKNVFARMLEENEHFQAYFDEMVSKDIGGKKVQTKREGPPVEEDWERSEGLAHFLRKFYDATLRLSATSTPSSHLILETLAGLKAEIESKISDFSCPTMQDVANQMKTKFDKYWGKINEVNPIIFIAQVLDPTIKLDMIDSVMEAFSATDGFIVEFKECIKKQLNLLFNAYKDGITEVRSSFSMELCGSSSAVTQPVLDSDFGMFRKKMMNKRKASQCMEIENEVDKYLNDPYESHNNELFDLLEWWKGNSQRYPTLSKITKDVFALPSSTVASENAFSLGGRVVDPFRASLTPKMVEALVCTNDWLRGEGFNFYKEPTNEEMDFYKELEEIEKDARHIG